MNPWYLLVALVIWFFFGIVISYLAIKETGKSIPEFFLASRRLKGFISGMMYSATTYSAYMLIGLVGLTYATGVGALGFEMTYLIFTILLLILFAPRFWIAGRKYGYVTPSELLAGRYENKWVGALSAIICLVMLIPYAAAQLMGIGYLLAGLTPSSLPYMFTVGVLIVATLCGSIAFSAGMRSVSWTDAFQAMIMIVASIVLVFFVVYHFFGSLQGFFSGVTTRSSDRLRLTWDIKKFIGLALPWAFFAITNPHVSKRMFVSDSSKSLKRMIIYFSLFGLAYTVITTLLGLSVASISGIAVPEGHSDKAMPLLLNHVPIILALIIFVSIFSAATSTLTSIILTLSSLGSRDLAKGIHPELSEKKELYVGRGIIIATLVACIIFAELKLNLIAILSAISSAGLSVMVPPIIGAFFWKRGTAKGALVSMGIGSILTGGMYLINWKPLGWWPSVWGLLTASLLFIGVSYLTQPPKKGEEFIQNIEEGMEEYDFK